MGGFPDGSLGKDPACNAEAAGGTGFDPWVGKIPWRRKWQPMPVFFFFFFTRIEGYFIYLFIFICSEFCHTLK